jgi:hypothetical protein
MKATLIEIDQGIAGQRWYASHPGLRLWARQKYGIGIDPLWNVLPGQEVLGTYVNSERIWVDLEHAWQVREGDVELRLIEIPNAAGPVA